ncbi:hypothetical protein HYH03_008019 [Edaphochlamys debaryana]|uniref:Protein kinase domain-containing protein n=1 Tax=Edaphochlamys debaryana TaxID=47281 RepID=A0A835Y115_9CHLO|nr:hypothetical protein HYH03_008019 [Edaphochlamys debaryana]|eukprot:KAG2493800.1 hypothetical protein HYH03_008019 [Edaphochlamys debaryana]
MFNSYSPALVLKRNVTVRLLPGTVLTFRWLLVVDYTDGSNGGSGTTFIEPVPSAINVVAFEECVYIEPACLPGAMLQQVLPTVDRVSQLYPGNNTLRLLPGVPDELRAAGTALHGDGGRGPPFGPCSNDTDAPPLQRCWAQVELYEDFAAPLVWNDGDLKRGPWRSSTVNRMVRNHALCLEVVSRACLETSGGLGCLMSRFRAYMLQRLNGSSIVPSVGIPVDAGTSSGSGGGGGGGGGLSDAELAGVIVASICGGLAILALAVAGVLHVQRSRLKRRKGAAAEAPEAGGRDGCSWPCQRDHGGFPGSATAQSSVVIQLCQASPTAAGAKVVKLSPGASPKGAFQRETGGTAALTGDGSAGTAVDPAGLLATGVSVTTQKHAALLGTTMSDMMTSVVSPYTPCIAAWVDFVGGADADERPEAAATGQGLGAPVAPRDSSPPGPGAAQPATADEAVTLGPRLLGAGAFGKVYEGEFRGQRVAVKVLTGLWGPGLHPAELTQAAECLRQEVEVLGRVSHPNVVRLLAACVTPPRMGLVLTIATHGASGLAYLHPTIVHKDIKPANVLVSGYGTSRLEVKLTDFGLARLRATHQSTAHPEAGTAAYTAPECFDVSNHVVTHAADMYSFGVLLWEMLVGHTPWEGLAPLAIALRVQLHGARPPLMDVHTARGAGAVPNKVMRLMQQCFDQEPRRRPAAAETVKQLLLAREQMAAPPDQTAPTSADAGPSTPSLSHGPSDAAPSTTQPSDSAAAGSSREKVFRSVEEVQPHWAAAGEALVPRARRAVRPRQQHGARCRQRSAVLGHGRQRTP